MIYLIYLIGPHDVDHDISDLSGMSELWTLGESQLPGPLRAAAVAVVVHFVWLVL